MSEVRYGTYRKGYTDALRDITRRIMDLPEHGGPGLRVLLEHIETLIQRLGPARVPLMPDSRERR